MRDSLDFSFLRRTFWKSCLQLRSRLHERLLQVCLRKWGFIENGKSFHIYFWNKIHLGCLQRLLTRTSTPLPSQKHFLLFLQCKEWVPHAQILYRHLTYLEQMNLKLLYSSMKESSKEFNIHSYVFLSKTLKIISEAYQLMGVLCPVQIKAHSTNCFNLWGLQKERH